MPILNVVLFPNPVLKKLCRPVDIIKHEERALLDNMLETMYVNQGLGLAAPQVGVSKRMIVVNVGEGPIQLVNPVITKREGKETGEEGCLCLPGILVKVKRAKKIVYKGLDRDGRVITQEAEGLLARVIQHEIDHLDGKVIFDYASPIKKILIRRQLRRSANLK